MSGAGTFKIGTGSVVDTDDPLHTWVFKLSDVIATLRTLHRYLGRSSRSVWAHSRAVASCALTLGKARGLSEAALKVLYCRALLHDASEAFTGDVPGPIKCRLGEAFFRFERQLQDRIYLQAQCFIGTAIGSVQLSYIDEIVHDADKWDYICEQEGCALVDAPLDMLYLTESLKASLGLGIQHWNGVEPNQVLGDLPVVAGEEIKVTEVVRGWDVRDVREVQAMYFLIGERGVHIPFTDSMPQAIQGQLLLAGGVERINFDMFMKYDTAGDIVHSPLLDCDGLEYRFYASKSGKCPVHVSVYPKNNNTLSGKFYKFISPATRCLAPVGLDRDLTTTY